MTNHSPALFFPADNENDCDLKYVYTNNRKNDKILAELVISTEFSSRMFLTRLTEILKAAVSKYVRRISKTYLHCVPKKHPRHFQLYLKNQLANFNNFCHKYS